MLLEMLSLPPNIIVHVENVVSLFSSPSTIAHRKYESVTVINFMTILTIASPELPKFAEMLLENDIAFITP